MNTEPVATRRLVYSLLITVAVAAVAGRILAVARVSDPGLARDDPGRSVLAILRPLAAANANEAAVLLAVGHQTWSKLDPDERRGVWGKTRPEPMPTHGDNDRSRWVTIRALVDHGTYVIGRRDPSLATPANKYGDVGLVTEDGWRSIDKVMNPDTNEYFSSKPPLLPTLLAGEYWLLKRVFGWSIVDDRWVVVRIILMTTNALPLVLYLWLLAQLFERYGTTDWGRLYVLAAACFGTHLTSFATTLNNHSVATYSAVFALYPALRAWEDPRAAGSACRFVLAGFFAGFTAVSELPAAAFTAVLGLALLLRAPARTLFLFAPAAAVPVAALFLTNYLALGEFAPAYEKFGTAWYEYEGSHWKPDPLKPKTGIDWASLRETQAEYAFHILAGHHGLFSLTPVFLLAVVGMLWGLAPRRKLVQASKSEPPRGALRLVALMTLALSVVVIGYYVFGVNDRSRNYGGWTTGLRWLIWLTPLWLLTMLPVADWLSGRRWGRGLAYLLLAMSVLSASYPALNPWRHPWLYSFMESQGWIRY